MGWEFELLTFISVLSGIIFFAFLFLIVLYLSTDPYPNLSRSNKECIYLDPNSSSEKEFPHLTQQASIDLSVIIPAYNEELRLPIMLEEALRYLDKIKCDYEIIVVDDGSTDKTSSTALYYSEKYGVERVRVLTLERNRGKGGAIRMGMMSSRGKELLLADADGATKFSEISKLRDDLKLRIRCNEWNRAVVCGSRAHLEKDSIAKRTFFRTLLMYGFHFWVWFFIKPQIKDTQCGFKLFTRPAARLLFSNLHVERWAFDVDILYLAQQFRIPVGEVPVEWKEIEGSKLVPIFSWLQMAKDILLIKLRYSIGAWKIDQTAGL